MNLSAVADATRPRISDVRRVRAVPAQFIQPAPVDLVRNLVAALDACVRPAAFVETEAAFQRHAEEHIGDFVALAVALGTQVDASPTPMPRLDVGERLVELLGPGADEELEICEATLWSVLRRMGERPSRPELGIATFDAEDLALAMDDDP